MFEYSVSYIWRVSKQHSSRFLIQMILSFNHTKKRRLVAIHITRWYVIFITVTIVSLVAIVVPISDLLSSLAIEIIGSLLGFLIAVSFSMAIQVRENWKRALDLVNRLREDVFSIVSDLERGASHEVPTEVWDMVVATGDLKFLDKKEYWSFLWFFRSIRHFNRQCRTMMQLTIVNAPQNKTDGFAEQLELSRKVVVLSGRDILDKVQRG